MGLIHTVYEHKSKLVTNHQNLIVWTEVVSLNCSVCIYLWPNQVMLSRWAAARFFPFPCQVSVRARVGRNRYHVLVALIGVSTFECLFINGRGVCMSVCTHVVGPCVDMCLEGLHATVFSYVTCLQAHPGTSHPGTSPELHQGVF